MRIHSFDFMISSFDIWYLRFLVDDLVRFFFFKIFFTMRMGESSMGNCFWCYFDIFIGVSTWLCLAWWRIPFCLKFFYLAFIYGTRLDILSPYSLCYHFQSCLVESICIHLHLMSLKCMQVDATKRGGIARFINHSCEVDIELYKQSLKLFNIWWILSW